MSSPEAFLLAILFTKGLNFRNVATGYLSFSSLLATRGDLLPKMSSSEADQRRTQRGARGGGVSTTKTAHSDTYSISPNNKR